MLSRLHEAGYASYLVGGGVRDALLDLSPKDFDVATDASPEQVKSLFRNARIIGRRFRLVHVVFGREIIEVATFRADHATGDGGEVSNGGRILRDNVFGTIEQDAFRRDFTINALYYNIADFSVVDFVGGLDDLESRTFRFIGDPIQRCEEDPVRVLRAARLSAKLDFDIEEDTLDAMTATAPLLVNMPPARLFEEVLKLFQGGYALKSFESLLSLDLVRYLFPGTDKRLRDEGSLDHDLLRAALVNTDNRIAEGKPVTPSYLLAFMLWGDIFEAALAAVADGHPPSDAIWKASDRVLPAQLQVTSIPKRFSGPMREIWSMQPMLEQYSGKRAVSIIENRRFRAAYDFLCLRAKFDFDLQDCAEWWTKVQEIPEDERLEYAEEKPCVSKYWGTAGSKKKRRSSANRKKRGRRKPRPQSGPPKSGNV